jgi:hypothetical protein
MKILICVDEQLIYAAIGAANHPLDRLRTNVLLRAITSKEAFCQVRVSESVYKGGGSMLIW